MKDGGFTISYLSLFESCFGKFSSDRCCGICIANCCFDSCDNIPRRSIFRFEIVEMDLMPTDLSGSLTFLSCIALSLYFPVLRRTYGSTSLGTTSSFPDMTSFHPRQLIMSGLTVLWTVRLGVSFLGAKTNKGAFLFHRVVKAGGDSRFIKIKKRVPSLLTKIDP